MLEELSNFEKEALASIPFAQDESTLDALRVRFLGKKGSIAAVGGRMRELSPEEKKVAGQRLNEVKSSIQSALDERSFSLLAERDAQSAEGVDLTLPPVGAMRGGLHPLYQSLDLAIRALRRMGFALASGPEVETEWHCFDALNTPEDHPARNESDTFYFADGRLLRTHTSTVQIRTMEAQSPPVRIIAPGAAFRRDEIDSTHLSHFTQLEALYVDADVSLADLKGTLEYFFRTLFGKETEVRFRPHFFPFTEPSYEVDLLLHAAGREPKWIEIGGCGMVDPRVFEAVCEKRGDRVFDPEVVTGFAFGMGIERLAMITYGIADIRLLIENDLRFLSQFR